MIQRRILLACETRAIALAIGRPNAQKVGVKIGRCSKDMIVDRQTHRRRQTDTLMTDTLMFIITPPLIRERRLPY